MRWRWRWRVRAFANGHNYIILLLCAESIRVYKVKAFEEILRYDAMRCYDLLWGNEHWALERGLGIVPDITIVTQRTQRWNRVETKDNSAMYHAVSNTHWENPAVHRDREQKKNILVRSQVVLYFYFSSEKKRRMKLEWMNECMKQAQ